MFFIMLISLYTSRKVLSVLGVDDYGIFNVVGGVISLLSFLNGSLSVATQRFLTYELGKNDLKQYNKVFSSSCIIHTLLAIVVVGFVELVGIWFLNNKMNIPVERLNSANWVFQTSVISMALSIIQTPYNASVIAHERMDIYAYISVGESILKLVAVSLLPCFGIDKLIVYGCLLLIIHLVVLLTYRFFCISLYQECRFQRTYDKGLLKSLLSFTGWNLFGSVAWILKDHGGNVLLNIFGGPAVNAARGIASQISYAVTNLVNGFQTAVNPQLTKNYASQNNREMRSLFYSSSKISFFLLLAIALPTFLEMDHILNVWLVDVPKYATLFSRLVLLESLLNTLGGPMITCLMATGKIKWYQIIVGSIMLINVPLSYLLLYLGFTISIPLYVSILLAVIALFARMIFVKFEIGIPLYEYLIRVLLPVVTVSLLASIFPVFCHMYVADCWCRLLFVAILSVLSVTLSSYFIGLNLQEKCFVKKIGRNIIDKLRWKKQLG